jgi:hypothetical protein
MLSIGTISASFFADSDGTLATTDATAPLCVTGVSISGSDKTAFLAKFPNSGLLTHHRKLK